MSSAAKRLCAAVAAETGTVSRAHSVLVLGDGDFTFSVSLAARLHGASVTRHGTLPKVAAQRAPVVESLGVRVAADGVREYVVSVSPADDGGSKGSIPDGFLPLDKVRACVLCVSEPPTRSAWRQVPPLPRLTLTSTCYEPRVDWEKRYQNKVRVPDLLQHLGVTVHFNVDATRVQETLGAAVDAQAAEHKGEAAAAALRKVPKFDRVIFNFPHPGGKNHMGKNRELLRGMFASASSVCRGCRK
jgi:hypothetical protein